MSRLRNTIGLAKVAVGVLLFAAATTACEEDSKTAPARCADPALPIYDIQTAGAPADDNARFNDDVDANGKPVPCITEVGHAVSEVTSGNTDTGGTATAGTGGASGSGGSAGKGGTAGAGGAGGSAGKGGSGGSAGKGGAGGTSGSGGKGGNAGTGGK